MGLHASNKNIGTSKGFFSSIESYLSPGKGIGFEHYCIAFALRYSKMKGLSLIPTPEMVNPVSGCGSGDASYQYSEAQNVFRLVASPGAWQSAKYIRV